MQVFLKSLSPAKSGQTDSGRRGAVRAGAAVAASVLVPAAALGGAMALSGAVSASGSTTGGGTGGAAACPTLLSHVFPRLQDDAPVSLCDFAGKVLLVVNTASQCGFTPQYEGLEKLHGRYASRGLVILGFPSNDFGQQEPGNSKQIGEVCFNTYGVRFPMFAKTSVTGAAANPLHAELARITGQAPRWNFHKYLVSRTGQPLSHYPSRVAPESRELVAAIEQALGAT